MVLWAAVDTKDPYKRLCAVADTAQELADMLGIRVKTIYECVSRARKGLAPERFIRVEVPDSEEEIQDLFSAVEIGRDHNCTVPEKDWLAYQAADMRKGRK